jgi:alpha-1,3-rhamnosyl/mannosyltransferase
VTGDAAVTLDPDDEDAWVVALERVLRDPEHADILRQAGLLRARQFTWERVAEATLGVYRQAAEGGHA